MAVLTASLLRRRRVDSDEGVRLGGGGTPGEGEEHVVEAGLGQLHGDDPEVRGVEAAHRLG